MQHDPSSMIKRARGVGFSNLSWRTAVVFWTTLLACVCAFMPAAAAAAESGPGVGVFYYPGWRSDTPGAPSNKPWRSIEPFADRMPLLGWYEEGEDGVIRQQLDWMIQYGLKFVAFDWYWTKDNHTFLDHAVSAYLRAPQRERLPFSLLWANHDDAPANQANFDRMIDWWIKYYVRRPEFLRVDGKPVVFLFSTQSLEQRAKTFGSSTRQLLASAQQRARDAGLPGFYFVAGVSADEPTLLRDAKMMGYSAVSAYNLHAPPGQRGKLAHSYKELAAAYQSHWRQYASDSPVPVILPLIAGWDRRPWGGTYDSRHDQCLPTLDEFKSHLIEARKAMEALKQTGPNLGVVCCWNEFGEGSFIEPTRAQGKARLELIQEVFGR